jgi:hypothetical protein
MPDWQPATARQTLRTCHASGGHRKRRNGYTSKCRLRRQAGSQRNPAHHRIDAGSIWRSPVFTDIHSNSPIFTQSEKIKNL